MSQSIFTTQTPTGGNFADAAPGLTLGTLFQADTAGTISGIRWYYPAILPGTAVIGLLYAYGSEAAGTELARATFASPTAGTWNTVLFASPVAIAANTMYVAAIFTTDRYVATSGLFASSGISNGHLIALANDDLGATNGKFKDGLAVPAYPSSHFGASCYFADVLYDPTNVPAQSGTSVAGLGATGSASKRAPTGGAASAGLALRAVTGRVAPVTGSCSLGGAATAAAARKVAAAGVVMLGASTRGALSGAHTGTGAAGVGLLSRAGTGRRVAQTGTSVLGLATAGATSPVTTPPALPRIGGSVSVLSLGGSLP